MTIHWKANYFSPFFLASKVLQMGPLWVLRRSLHVFRRGRPKIQLGRGKQSQVLYAFYDLSSSPASFDFVSFLVPAEHERIRRGLAALHVLVVPSHAEGVGRKPKELNDQGWENVRWRIRNVVAPCAWLVSGCQGVTVCATRAEAEALLAGLSRHVYPVGYTLDNRMARHDGIYLSRLAARGESLPSLRATPLGAFYVRQWMSRWAGGRRVVTLSLRESSYRPLRNSNLMVWSDFARWLQSEGYYPVFVRDTEKALEPLPPELEALPVFPEAAWNVELRAALYEASYLNLSVNNGPAILCVLNAKSRYLNFKMEVPEYISSRKDFFPEHAGFEAGGQWPVATAFQKLVWEDDRFEVLEREFRAMCAKIEGTAERATAGRASA